ncbi:MAG: hypothetical protein ABIS47_11705 [Acidimicrobiales bacterium]
MTVGTSRHRRGRWWWPRHALPRSPRALILSGLLALVVVVLLLLGLTRTRPGHTVPTYDPATSAPATTSGGPVPRPVITAAATVAPPPTAPSITTKRRR